MLKSSLVALLLGLVLQPASYKADIEAFRKQREAEIGGETGWAALTDLHWVTPGSHTIGRAPGNDVILTAPSAPERLGTITVADETVALHVAAGVAATVNAKPVADVRLAPNSPSSDDVAVGGMRIAAIKRGARIGLRVWDRAAPTRLAFTGLHWYAIDPKWRVDATFVPHRPAGTIKIQNIIGDLIDLPNPGTAVFSVNGRQYALEALLESSDADELFFMFKDGTSNKTTYGAGRYLYTPLPKDGHVTLDFNSALNPPCAFTNFATCPLPPPKNRLSVSITAGELNHEGR